MGEVKFSNEAIKEYEEILKKYPKSKSSAIMPILHLAIKEFGKIDKEVVIYLSKLMGFPPNKIWGTASFYTLYSKEKLGKYVIYACHNLTCSIKGAISIIRHIEDRLEIKEGETTKDGLFSLIAVECLGACGYGPVIQINDKYYLNVTEEKIDDIIDKILERERNERGNKA